MKKTLFARLWFTAVLIFSVPPTMVQVQFLGSAQPSVEPLSLWYRQPATKWTEALPLGNGRIGAMVFGGVTPLKKERFTAKTLIGFLA